MTATGATEALSEFASGLRFDDLPDTVVDQAKRSILDTLGCGLHGSTLPWSRTALRVLQRQSAGGPATAWGTPATLSVTDAALVNGTCVHGFELDDLHKDSALHMGSISLPATLALSQLSETPVTGRDLITAQVAGYEVGARIGMSAAMGFLKRGFHVTGVIGALGAAAASARLLGLDTDGARDAIGTAGSFACGLGAAQYGSTVKRMHAGRAAQGGATAALLAAEGFRGIRDLFEREHGGFFGTFTGEWNADELTDGLGTRWHTEVIGYKPYPACAASHTSIDAALALLEEGVRVEDIEHVLVTGATSLVEHVGWDYEPDTVTTAQMNLAFAVACTFLDGRCVVDQFTEDRLADPAVLDLTRRIEVRATPEADARGRAYRHAVSMTVRTRDGREHVAGFDHGLGSEHRPLRHEQVVAKYTDLAGRAVPADRVQAIAGLVNDLEDVKDVGELARLLATG